MHMYETRSLPRLEDNFYIAKTKFSNVCHNLVLAKVVAYNPKFSCSYNCIFSQSW